ncbi:MAG: hypothetical protein HRF50_04545 [Phycisphaerae bacterium]|jgi:hypothetical protein
MAATITEHVASRSFYTGRNPSAELIYTVRGTNDESEVYSLLAATSPVTFAPWGSELVTLPRESLLAEPGGDQLWHCRVRYGTGSLPTDSSEFSFDTTGGNEHVIHARATVSESYAPGILAWNHHKLIGVNGDNVEGIDIVVPVYTFAETHYKAESFVDTAYKGVVYGLTGRVNDATFRGLAAGECLFLGVYGSKRAKGDWELTYRFSASPNVADIPIGEHPTNPGQPLFTVPAKKGWEIIHFAIADDEDADGHKLIKKPIAAFVEQLYLEGDFSALGIGS